MSANTLAKTAYASSTETVRSPRAVEYEIIAQVTHNLKSAAEDKSHNYSRFAEAIHRNNQLWTVLAASVVDPDNELPKDVRAQLFYLSEFTRRQAAQALAGKANILPLLQINTAILRGLRQGKGM